MRRPAKDRGAAARRLAQLASTPPTSLEVRDVGPAGDGWVLVSVDAAEPEVTDLPEALRDVLASVLRGETNAAIARRRGTSVRTVENQVAALLVHFGAHSRIELARLAMRPG